MNSRDPRTFCWRAHVLRFYNRLLRTQELISESEYLALERLIRKRYG